MKTIIRLSNFFLAIIILNFFWSFSVLARDFNYSIPEVPVQSISFSQDAVYLSTLPNAIHIAEVTAILEPANTTEEISWSIFSTTEVATIKSDGTSVQITAKAPGTAILTATVGSKTADLIVYVNNSSVISDEITVQAQDPDNFSVIVSNVHSNPALTTDPKPVEGVSIFCWSTEDQSDMNAKQARQDGPNWIFTFPVNQTGANNHFLNADNIIIHAYANGKDYSDFLGKTYYSWQNAKSLDNHNAAYIGYSRNVGFMNRSSYDGSDSGIIGNNQPLEGIRVSSGVYGVQINTSVHAHNVGWMNAVSDGQYAGTMNQSRHIEAINLSLEGMYKDQYKLTYRVHIKDRGWSEWKNEGEIAGTTGQNLPIEAVNVKLEKR